MKQKLIELKETNLQLQLNISRLFVINRTDRKGEETGDLNHGTKVTNWIFIECSIQQQNTHILLKCIGTSTKLNHNLSNETKLKKS